MPAPRRLQLESLEARRVFATAFIEAEPNSVATSANVVAFDADGQVSLQGSTHKDDKDFFQFNATASGPLNVSIGGTRQAKLEIENSASQKLLELEPKEGAAAGAVVLVAGLTYRVRVIGTDSASVNYTVSLAQAANVTPPAGAGENGGTSTPPASGTTVSEVEANNSKLTANRFSLSDATQLVGTTSKEDRDFFAFQAPATGTLAVNVAVGSTAKVEIEDQSSIQVLKLEPKDGLSVASTLVEAGRTYFVRVRGDASAAQAYAVDLKFTAGTAAPAVDAAGVAQTANVFDVNDDDFVTPLDALLVINHLNSGSSNDDDFARFVMDLNHDSFVTPLDALLMINHINAEGHHDDPVAHDLGDDHGVDVAPEIELEHAAEMETEIEHLTESEIEAHTGADDSVAAFFAELERIESERERIG